MIWISLCVLGFLVTPSWGNYTFTYEMASQCKEHICRHGYRYETYYEADPISRGINHSGEDVTFEMHIAILASSNGHILLSTVPEPKSGDPVYEIVVGGGGNTFTQLRRNLKSNPKSTATTYKILSAIEYRAFYIKMLEDGTIEFGKEGEPPLLSYFDTLPVAVKYFSFTAWNGVEAKFLYDCPVFYRNGSESSATHSKVIERKLSPREQLKRELLRGRAVDVAPSPVMDIAMDVFIKSVRFHAFESKLETDITFAMSWTDESMAWDPSKDNGTSTLRFRLGEVWTPTFSVINSADIGLVQQSNTDPIVMYNNGEASIHFDSKVFTWCVDYSGTYNKWPRDEHYCTIFLNPWNIHEDYRITYTTLIGPATLGHDLWFTENPMETEWLTTARQLKVDQSTWNGMFGIPQDNDTAQSDKFLIAVNLVRRGTSYNIALYTPLIVLMTFLVMSFWSDAPTKSRLRFYCGCVLIVCTSLCYINHLMPCHTVPTILVLYIMTLGGCLLALIINAGLMTHRVQQAAGHRWLRTLLMMKWIRVVFGLAPLKTCQIYETINESFATLEDAEPGVSSRTILEEMETEDTRQSELEELATVIDKVLFVVYSVTFAVMLACHY